MVSIGCDLGLVKSGIVCLNDRFEIQNQDLIKVGSRGAERLVDIERAFDYIVKPYRDQPLEVFVEGYAYEAKYQRESLAELGGVIRRYLYLTNLNYWIIPPTRLKAFVTGSGKATKNYMKKCTKDKWGEIFKSDDVCDAYGLSRLGMCAIKAINGVQGIGHLPQNEQNAIKDIILNQEYYKNSNTSKKRSNGDRKRKTKS